MKTKLHVSSYRLLTSVLIVFGFLGSFNTIYAQGVDFYYVGEEKVLLKKSDRYQAIKADPQISPQGIKSFRSELTQENFEVIEDANILRKYKVVLIKLHKGIVPQPYTGKKFGFIGSNYSMENLQVYSVDEVDQILVNEFLVQFKENTPEQEVTKLFKKYSAVVVEKDIVRSKFIISFPGKNSREALTYSNLLHKNPLVEYSEPNFIRIYPSQPIGSPDGTSSQIPSQLAPSTSDGPNDTHFAKQWGLRKTETPGAWKINKGSEKIIIAIIDNGVDSEHPDLKQKIITPYNAMNKTDNASPKNSDAHGTACAGIAAAVTDNSFGVAGIGWNVKLMPIKISESNGRGGWITTNKITAEGIDKAIDRHAHVLSNSWGGGSVSNEINHAIDRAIQNMRIVVFAAGNQGNQVDYPARLSTKKTVIAVSASNEWDELKTKTSKDGENWWASDFGPEVTVSAPGVHIYSTDISGKNGYDSGDYIKDFRGTSSGAPFVAGLAALVLSKNPSLTPLKVRELIQNGADDLGVAGFDEKFGYGRINSAKTLSITPEP